MSRATAKFGVFFLGVISAGAGLLLRVNAHGLAWPREAASRVNDSFSGNPGEKLFIDLGMVFLVFGLALLFLSIVRATRTPRSA